MAFFPDLAEHLAVLEGLCGKDVTAADLPGVIARLSGEDAVAVITEASAVVRAAEQVRVVAAGVVAAESTRQHGHSGVAQTRGHGSPVSLVQELMGSTKADAAKHVRLGTALLETASATADRAATVDTQPDASPRVVRWHAPLGAALMAGALSSAQHDVILRGLGDPPTGGEDAWRVAAEQLIGEAAERTVEDLARAARTVRDMLDPEGAARRFDERFEARSWRVWSDRDGLTRGSIVFDDHAAAWVRTIIDTALRPRRGGPRFVDPTEKQHAQHLADDPRSNDQLAYDLLIDTLRAGALADPETVFGTRQPGIRIVITHDALTAVDTGTPAVAVTEDHTITLPAWLAVQTACDTGTAECTVDRVGNPLYLGREARLFSSKQRLALAIRDGGCRWRGCDRPASYCEAHHIDEYVRDEGCTDIDRGILLCRFHHMHLHHGGWRITRHGLGDFLLHAPDDSSPLTLKPRLPLRHAWGDLAPPPKRFRPAA